MHSLEDCYLHVSKCFQLWFKWRKLGHADFTLSLPRFGDCWRLFVFWSLAQQRTPACTQFTWSSPPYCGTLSVPANGVLNVRMFKRLSPSSGRSIVRVTVFVLVCTWLKKTLLKSCIMYWRLWYNKLLLRVIERLTAVGWRSGTGEALPLRILCRLVKVELN